MYGVWVNLIGGGPFTQAEVLPSHQSTSYVTSAAPARHSISRVRAGNAPDAKGNSDLSMKIVRLEDPFCE